MLRSKFPAFVAWGRERTYLYDGSYAVILGKKHPKALCHRLDEAWPEIWEDLLPIIEEVNRGKSMFFEDLRLVVDRTGMGEEFADAYFTFAYSPVLNERWEIGGFHCNVVETTKSVVARQELLRTHKEVTDILEYTNDGFFSVDKNWIITRVNTNHEIFTEGKREDQLGKSLLDLYFSAPELKQSPVNEEKRVQGELVHAKEEAERANHLKSAFLANMSHEIRTPLGAMMGFADLLREPGISDGERSSYIDILRKNGEQFGLVINDILDLSKVETGHINFEYLRVRPAQIARDVVSLMSVVANEKKDSPHVR